MTTTIPFLPVHGTWGFGRGEQGRWIYPDSPFCALMAGHAFALLSGDDPFVWDGDIDGADVPIPFLLRPFFPRRMKHSKWICAAVNFRRRHEPDDLDDLELVIGHSHALQLILYACAGVRADGTFGRPLRIRRLVSVMSPVREDMREIAQLARPNIGYWEHLHSDHSDLIQVAGSLLDGRWGIVREHPLADHNRAIAGVGHSGMLEDPTHFHLWADTFTRLRAA